MKQKLLCLGDHTFNLIYLIVSSLMVYLSFAYEITYLQIISIALVKVGVFTFTATWAIKFLNGLHCNIYNEIFEKDNIAAAILVAGLLIGLAIVISAAV